MFGHQDDQSTAQDSNSIPDEAIHGVLNDQSPAADALPAPTLTPTTGDAWQHPGAPLDGDGAAKPEEPVGDVISPAGGFPKAPTFPAPPAFAPPSQPADDDSAKPKDDDDDATQHELIDIKQHALSELSPLIDQLDLPPEEKFRTVMMLIQASDDEHLVKAAYESAHAITDEKVRARALLDIVNEINYFTQQPETKS